MTSTTRAPSPHWARLADATAFALATHANQVRKGTAIPYASHLLAVSSLVLEHGGDEDQAIAGLLHDSIEDQGVSPALLRDRFGERVARIVVDCTDADIQPKPPWRQRKERYLAHLEHVAVDSLLVSAADKLHNARAIVMDAKTHGLALFDRFSQPRESTLWYYQSLATVFAARLPSPLARELGQVVDDMHMVGLAPARSPS